MTDRNVDEGNGTACSCKIGRITDQYDLEGIDDELVAYWTGAADIEERYSTRQLATYLNQRVLEAALDDAGLSYKDGEIENTYRLLTDDDVSSGTRIQTRSELERESVPIEQVESDFVSHQTVYNHLRNCLGASLESPSDEERIEQSMDKLGALRNRTVAVTKDTISQLERNDVVETGPIDVLVDITIMCEDCYQQYTVEELLDRGGCDCHVSESDEMDA